MKRIAAILVAVALLAFATPAVQAGETVSKPYIGTAGVRILGVGPAVMCPEFCLGENNPFPGSDFGGAALAATGVYTNVIVSGSDDVYGTNVGVSSCFYNPDGDNICDDDDYGSDRVCGTVALLGSPFAGNEVITWAYTIIVTEDLEQCGASQGVMTGDFF